MAFPNPSNVAPWYLRNITQALALDETSGNVYLRTDAQIGTINIAGNVNIPGNINARVYELGNVNISGNTLPVSGTVTALQGNIPWIISNTNVAITSGNVGINGNIAGITALPPITGNVGILGNVNVTQGNIPWIISNTNVTVTSGNLTVNQGTTPWVISNTNVAITSGNVGILGNVNVNPITGNVVVTGNVGILGNVNVNPITGNVDVTGNVGILGNVNVNPVTGNVTITGNANVTGNVGILGNVNVTQGTDPWVITGNVNATSTITGNVSTVLGGTNLDAFGRLRISNPVTLFDTQNMYVDGGQFSNVTANGGTVTYLPNESSFNLAVTTANGSSVISQCKTTQPYQPGKSLLCMHSFAFAPLTIGCRQRVGQFTENNGIYFEADGLNLYLVIRSKASGTVQEERIPQANWNTNTMQAGPGPNPSGVILDPSLVNIFWCDVEWLGVGNVRTGFIVNGQFVVCHVFQHANQTGNTTVYMTSATLNPRYEITNTATLPDVRTMKQICSTVISEGGYAPAPTVNYVGSGIIPTRLSNANVYTNLATIRLNPSCIDAVVLPGQIDLLLTDVQYGAFQLVVGASNVAGLTYANVTGGVVQANTSPVEIGDGKVVYAGVTSSRDTFNVGDDVAKRLQLSRHANGTPITLTLCAGYGNPNADIIWKFGWEEVTN